MEVLLDAKVLLTDFEQWELTAKRKKSERVKRDKRKEKKIRDLEVFEKRGYKPKKHGKEKRHPLLPKQMENETNTDFEKRMFNYQRNRKKQEGKKETSN